MLDIKFGKCVPKIIQEGSEGLRQQIFKSSLFHHFMYNRGHLGGLNLKAVALKCKSRSTGQILCYKMSKFNSTN